MDKKEYEKRNRGNKDWKKNKYWVKGYEAAKKGLKKEDNPYKLPEDIWKLLRKRTWWLLGFEERQLLKRLKHGKERKEKNKKEKKDRK